MASSQSLAVVSSFDDVTDLQIHNSSILGLEKDIKSAKPILKDRVYFMVTRYRPRNTSDIHFFSIDNILRYEPFFVDFGPLNLSCLYKFCVLLKHKLKDSKLLTHKIYYYCDKDPQKIGNAAYLIGCFQLIELGKHPEEAYQTVKSFAQKSAPFRDASMGICTYKCTVEHCIWGVYRALQRSFLDFNKFNIEEYEHHERVEYGDLNVIIPNKFIAFAGPNATPIDGDGYPALTPDFYVPIWKKFGVTTIIRLNKKCYDKSIFTKAGLDHYDLYYVDGTCPSRVLLKKFIQICENAKGVIAVHCKAGLGRTGSCIGCYIMKHYGWTASETIAWLRVCRPGSVIGPQQHFLEEQQPLMWKEGEEYRNKKKEKAKLSILSSLTDTKIGLRENTNHSNSSSPRSQPSSPSQSRLQSGSQLRSQIQSDMNGSRNVNVNLTSGLKNSSNLSKLFNNKNINYFPSTKTNLNTTNPNVNINNNNTNSNINMNQTAPITSSKNTSLLPHPTVSYSDHNSKNNTPDINEKNNNNQLVKAEKDKNENGYFETSDNQLHHLHQIHQIHPNPQPASNCSPFENLENQQQSSLTIITTQTTTQQLSIATSPKMSQSINPLPSKSNNAILPLPTDPGQNQGQALIDAKRRNRTSPNKSPSFVKSSDHHAVSNNKIIISNININSNNNNTNNTNSNNNSNNTIPNSNGKSENKHENDVHRNSKIFGRIKFSPFKSIIPKQRKPSS